MAGESEQQKETDEELNEEEAQVRSEQGGSTARSQQQSTTRLARKRQLRLRSVDWSQGNSRLHNRRDVSYRGSVGVRPPRVQISARSAPLWRPST
jgi:hypothetical protein